MDGLTDGNSAAPASTGPATFAEAFAADASSAADPSASATTPPAAAQPAQDAAGTTPADKDRSPFIPRSRFDEVNTRLGELTKWKEQHGWVEGVDRAAVDQAVQIAQRFQQDPGGYIKQLLSEAISNPQLAPMVRSEMARFLGQRPQASAPPAAVDLTPIPVQMEDGRTLNMLTAEQWDAREAKLREEFAPAVQTAKELKAARDEAEAIRQADAFAAASITPMMAFPQFKEHAKEIAEYVNKAKLATGHPAEVEAATLRAYATIVVPKLDQASQSKLLDNLQQKAAASRSPNPGSAAPSAPADIKSFTDRRLTW